MYQWGAAVSASTKHTEREQTDRMAIVPYGSLIEVCVDADAGGHLHPAATWMLCAVQDLRVGDQVGTEWGRAAVTHVSKVAFQEWRPCPLSQVGALRVNGDAMVYRNEEWFPAMFKWPPQMQPCSGLVQVIIDNGSSIIPIRIDGVIVWSGVPSTLSGPVYRRRCPK